MGCMTVQERYTPYPMGANEVLNLPHQSIGGFLCITDGTLTIEDNKGVVLLDEFPVKAGSYYPIVMYIGANGGVVTLSGGASGTLLS